MAFSLSPSVQVTEQDFSLNVQNLPTSQTGMVIRAEQGPALEIVRITNESDLVNNFGAPNSRNFKDFFNAWNFLQYSNTLYVVRALASSGTTVNTANAGIKFASDSSITSIEKTNLYNKAITELTMSTHTTASGIEFYNKYCENSQKLAVAICSSNASWSSAVSTELVATMASAALKGATTITVASAGNTLASGNYIDFGTIEIPILSVASAIAPGVQTVTLSSGIPFDLSVSAKVRTANYTSSYQTSAGVLATFKSFFDYEPNWSNGEFVYLVFKKNDSGLYDLVEKNLVSYNEAAKDNSGNSIFVDNYTFNFSNYVVTKTSSVPPSINTASAILTKIRATANSLCSASDIDQGDVEKAFDIFGDSESVDINILVNHELSENYASAIAESRKDCFTIVAPFDSTIMLGKSATDATSALCTKYGTQTTGTKNFSQNGTYSAIFGNMKYQYDRWNDVNRWVPVHGDVAGLFAQTDSNRDPWWAPAGSERGVMRNVIKLAFNPNKANRDTLYVNAINPIFSIPGEGQGVIFGQKTATTAPTATDRINVRRLLLTIEKAIAKTARVAIFEFNDDITRNRLRAAIEPYLGYVQSRRGLYEYKVVVDTTNNTSYIIDANALVIDIFVKPTKVAEFIQVNAKILGSNASITEYTGSKI